MDYVLRLRENHSLKVKKSGQAVFKRGDVVVLKSDTSKRSLWKLGIVDNLLMGADDRPQAAVIKVSEPQGGTKLLSRTVKHLFPIEVRVEDFTNDSSTEQTQEQLCNLASAQQPNDNSTQTTS